MFYFCIPSGNIWKTDVSRDTEKTHWLKMGWNTLFQMLQKSIFSLLARTVNKQPLRNGPWKYLFINWETKGEIP